MRGSEPGSYVPEAYEGTIRWHDQHPGSANTLRPDLDADGVTQERIVLGIDHGPDEEACVYLDIEQARELARILIIKADLLQARRRQEGGRQ